MSAVAGAVARGDLGEVRSIRRTPLKLRAQFTIDIDTGDLIGEAGEKYWMAAFQDEIKTRFDNVVLTVHGRRSQGMSPEAKDVRGASVGLRACVVVDFNAKDYVAAAVEQQFLEKKLDRIRRHFPVASLTLSDRRDRTGDFVAK